VKPIEYEPFLLPSFEPIKGISLPDVGEESLEILLDWYEKHYTNPPPNKHQLKKMSEITGLNKSTIRAWTSAVRKVRNLN
jgi:hypothetical protein